MKTECQVTQVNSPVSYFPYLIQKKAQNQHIIVSYHFFFFFFKRLQKHLIGHNSPCRFIIVHTVYFFFNTKYTKSKIQIFKLSTFKFKKSKFTKLSIIRIVRTAYLTKVKFHFSNLNIHKWPLIELVYGGARRKISLQIYTVPRSKF